MYYLIRVKTLLGREIFRLKNHILRNRRFLHSVRKSRGTEASHLINSLCKLNEASNDYLEIGVEYGLTFEAVQIKRKVGVDPHPKFNTFFRPRNTRFFSDTSDNFFESSKNSFDFIFLDGLHTFEQTWKDIQNSFRVLTDKGMLLIDDTVPCDEFSALPDQLESYKQRELAGKARTGSWHGDVFKVLWVFSEFFTEELDWYTIADLINPKTLVLKKTKDSYSSIFSKPFSLDAASNRTFLDTFNGTQGHVIRPISKRELFIQLAL